MPMRTLGVDPHHQRDQVHVHDTAVLVGVEERIEFGLGPPTFRSESTKLLSN